MQIKYIAGNGHSGSTLLDMMLGNGEFFFSGGELINIARESISGEYCSCGSTIGECRMWRKVMASWASSRSVSMAEYRKLRQRYELNETLPRLMLNMIRPSRDFLAYCAATQSLFESIQKVTNSQVVIDSSKSAARILILKRFSNLTVYHLCRNFTGVMNSLNRYSPRNLKEGIEADLHPTPPHRALMQWVLNNFLVSLLSIGVRRHRVHYRQMVTESNATLRKLGDEFQVRAEQKYSADHMLAGNVIRLRKNIELDPGVGVCYGNLSKRQIRFGALIDRVFWFWA